MVDNQDFELVYSDSIPRAITFHIGMMMIFGVNGEAFIEEITEKKGAKTFVTKFKDKTHIFTMQENILGNLDLIVEYDVSETKKCVTYMSNVSPIF